MLHNRDRIRVSRLPANVEDTPENRDKFNVGRMGIVLNTAEQFGNIAVTIDETQNTLEDVLLIPADCVEVVRDQPTPEQRQFMQFLAEHSYQPFYDHTTGEYSYTGDYDTIAVARNLTDLLTKMRMNDNVAALLVSEDQ